MSTSLPSFLDELEKIALSIRRAELPGMGHVMGMYLNPARIQENAAIAAPLARGRTHLLLEKPMGELRQMMGGMRDFAGKPELIEQAAQAARKSMARHELTHYLRDRAGHMAGVGQPGLRNVLRTAREEAIAYGNGLKPFEKMGPQYLGQAAAGIPAGIVSSVRQAYANTGGAARAALGGTLKPLLPWAQRLGLIKGARAARFHARRLEA
jgi:hypothetical protein